jgi:hypothetical protein
MEWDLTDKKKFGHKAGSVRIGAGYTYALSMGLGRGRTYSLGHAQFTVHVLSCSLAKRSLFKIKYVTLMRMQPLRHGSFGRRWGEVHKEAAENDRVVSSGYAKTVGVVGWSLGSGHGPLAPKLGLGGDNILEVDIVTANGTLVTGMCTGHTGAYRALGVILSTATAWSWTWHVCFGAANAKKNSDLFFAVRGGGGTTWGIVTAMTVRAHPIPEGGFTIVYVDGFGDLCEGFEAVCQRSRNGQRCPSFRAFIVDG